jgi:hypothetical protein
VVLQAAFLDSAGNPLASEAPAEHRLQRVLDMSTNPWTEVRDTRLLPGQGAEVALGGAAPAGAVSLRLRVRVEPDEFYARFYEERLRERPEAEVAAQYRRALERALSTPYTLFERVVPIEGGPPVRARSP